MAADAEIREGGTTGILVHSPFSMLPCLMDLARSIENIIINTTYRAIIAKKPFVDGKMKLSSPG